jgi:hypothetical protein
LLRGRPARAAGNRVFPNGFIECQLEVPRHRAFRLLIRGDREASPGFRLTVNGSSQDVIYGDGGFYEQRFPAASTAASVTVRIQKTGADYPWIFGVATIADSE